MRTLRRLISEPGGLPFTKPAGGKSYSRGRTLIPGLKGGDGSLRTLTSWRLKPWRNCGGTVKTGKVISLASPPANPEAEQATIGAILVRPEVLPKNLPKILAPSDFYQPAHGRIFQTMLDLRGKNEPVDLVTVTALLKDRGQLEVVGGPVFLAALSELGGFAINAPFYAQKVSDEALKRRFKEAIEEVARAVAGPIDNLPEFLDHNKTRLLGAIERKGAKGPADDQTPRVIPASILLRKEYPREQEIIAKGILPKGGGLILAGESGEGKSLNAN